MDSDKNSASNNSKTSLEALFNLNENSSKLFRLFIEKLSIFQMMLDKYSKELSGQEINNETTEIIKQESEKLLKIGDELENSANNKKAIKSLKEFFREKLSLIYKSSPIMERAFKKPRGYAGDFEILEIVYDNKIIGLGLGAYFDYFLLNDNYATAVRNRKDLMVKYLGTYFSMNKNRENLKILNVACGSSRDIKELLLSIKNIKPKVHFFCLDQDADALSFSEGQLKKFAGDNFSFDFVLGDIAKLISSSDKENNFLEKFDLIYSIGLADYLPDRFFGKMLQYLFSLLNNQGRIVIAHKDYIKYKPLPQDWYCDWHFFPRTEEEVNSLIKKSLPTRDADIKIFREPSGTIYFLEISNKH